jgi:carboxyl-terminal processing protease
MLRSGLRYVVLIVALAITLSASAQVDERQKRDFDLGCKIEILANMMRELECGYVEEVSADELLKAAARGMLLVSDPYTEYLSEEAMEDFEVMTTGRYGGVGSLIRKKGDYIIFAQPYKGSPSDVAGVKIGDKILAIGDEDMRGATASDVSSRLRGEAGTDIRVVIERNISGAIDTLSIRRERITVPSVNYAGMLRDGVGYISHNDFIEGSYDEMRRAVESLMAQGELKGLVLDYRSNGGGVMQEAVDIASLFVPRGEQIVSIMGRDSSSLTHYNTRYAPIAEDIPIVVLVSGSSASASEILAGALQDLDRAVVMGSRTYGKGLVQGTRYLGYNTYLKYTTAKYYIPSGRCIQSRNYASMRNDGVATEVPDSLISEFTTRGGRRVYDGGGIVPDVKIAPEYVSRFAIALYTQGFIEDWADEYMRKHHAEPIDINTFSITDEDYEEFCRFVADKDISYESETRKALKALEAAAEKELYSENMDEALEMLKGLVHDDNMSNLKRYRRDIVEALNGDIILRYAYNSGVLQHSAATDSSVAQAVELLLNREEYERILSQQHLEMH